LGPHLPRHGRIFRPKIGSLMPTAISPLGGGKERFNPTRFASFSKKLTSASNRSPMSEERFLF
jgi:hypothetical protein